VAVLNPKNEKTPVAVKVNSTKNGKTIVCDEKMCISFKMYQFCSHTVAVAVKTDFLAELIKLLNKKCSNVLTKAVLGNKEKSAGKKRTKATQNRKGPPNKKPTKIAQLIDGPNNAVPLQPLVEPKPPNQFQFQPTLPQYPAIQTSYPAGPMPGTYTLTLLRFCHANVSTCYGCSGKLRVNSASPNDLIVVSKTQRIYFDKMIQQQLVSPAMSNVYFHFNRDCILRHDQLFSPYSINIPETLKPYFSEVHVALLTQCSLL